MVPGKIHADAEGGGPVPEDALARLMGVLGGLDGLVVAYSGGVDTTLLAAVAHRVLGARSLAVTVDSNVSPPGELAAAVATAVALGFGHKVVGFDWLAVPELVENRPDRCYRCKLRIMTLLRTLAQEMGFPHLADGTNADDHAEGRPGLLADRELGVRQPLYEAGLDKRTVRLLARRLGLPNADRPAMPCLATRFPAGRPVTREGLVRVGRAETALSALGFPVVRVRDLYPYGVVEVPRECLSDLWRQGDRVVRALGEAGYRRAVLDLAGYGATRSAN